MPSGWGLAAPPPAGEETTCPAPNSYACPHCPMSCFSDPAASGVVTSLGPGFTPCVEVEGAYFQKPWQARSRRPRARRSGQVTRHHCSGEKSTSNPAAHSDLATVLGKGTEARGSRDLLWARASLHPGLWIPKVTGLPPTHQPSPQVSLVKQANLSINHTPKPQKHFYLLPQIQN